MDVFGFVGSILRPLVDAWPKVADILEVRPIRAVTIVERIVRRRQFVLYTEDVDTGLWNPIPSAEVSEVLEQLGYSDYAQHFFNDPTTPVDTETASIRISPSDLDAILLEAATGRPPPSSRSGSDGIEEP